MNHKEILYIPPFSQISKCIESTDGSENLSLPTDLLTALLGLLCSAGVVDQEWYANAYNDVAEALKDRRIDNSIKHFSKSGYFEGRLPRMFKVDEDWYLKRYPDVARAVDAGEIASAHTHFNTTGYFEGRVPCQEMIVEVEYWNHLVDKFKLLDQPSRDTIASTKSKEDIQD